ncbi:MAG: class I SAM-dependent methyltransferase [Planctomycetales bacterium]
MKKRHKEKIPSAPRIPIAEQLLIDELPQIHERRILCTTLGRGQFALAARAQDADFQVVLHEFDVFLAERIRQQTLGPSQDAGVDEWEVEVEIAPSVIHTPPGLASAEPVSNGQGGFEVVCLPDFPEGEFDLVALPIDPRGEAELTRELLQTAHCRLPLGGRLMASTSNPKDQWLHAEFRKLFSKVTRRPSSAGVLYLATKTAPLKKLKCFECEFAFRDQGRLIRAISRPGVFNHRGLDAGARALINLMQVGPGPGAKVLDLGCGSGVVALAAAVRAAGVEVTAIDSHARAIECTQRGAALNGLPNVTTVLDADGQTGAPGTFDLVACNPPYFSDYKISEIFLQSGCRALKPGGTLLVVTKAVEYYVARMPELFDQVVRHQHKLYSVFEARQRG